MIDYLDVVLLLKYLVYDIGLNSLFLISFFVAIIAPLTIETANWFKLVKPIGRLVPLEFLGVHQE
jgi:hypothetical protein